MKRALPFSMIVALAGCAPAGAPMTAQVMAFTCDAGERYTEASVTVRNTSAAPLTHLKVHIRLGDMIEDRYLQPLEIPSNAMATASIGRRGQHGCQLLGVQDERGRAIALSN